LRAITLFIAVFALMAGSALAQVPAHATAEKVLGRADAPVTIIEYASMTCPHCASFHRNTLPAIKKQFIDTGKARLIMRDFPLDRIALQAATVARCAPEGQYFNVIDALFRSQERWAQSPDPTAAIAGIARLSGMSRETVDSCLASEALQRDVLEDRLTGERSHGVQSTPSFVINGQTIAGDRGPDAFIDIINQKLGTPKGT
jgi:protein-disulfide isomerase